MKRIVIGAALLAMSASALHAQLSLTDRVTLRHQQAEARGKAGFAGLRKSASAPSEPHVSTALLKLAPGATAADLEAEGVRVAAVRGDIAMVGMPTDRVEHVASLKSVARLELSRERRVMMEAARPSAGVSPVHAGIELDRPYTGKGVLVGIVDQGMDPNHINFRNSDGSSRIGLLNHFYTDYTSADGWTGDAYLAEDIPAFRTDDPTTFHGTHTMGILAGGYRGPITAAVASGPATADVKELDSNPFYGVAFDAEIAAGCGELMDMFIALGIDQILSYREYVGKPAVISLSLGSNTGSHNPNALMSQFLDLCAEDAIIVLSAGNEGDIPLAITKNLTDDSTTVQSFVIPTYQANVRYGQVYFYSPEEFTLQAVVYNKKRGRISYRMPVKEDQGAAEPQYYCSADYAEYDTDIVASQFATAFSGYVGVGWDKEPYTGEHMCLMDYYTLDNETSNASGDYILGFVVEGKPGQRIECYCDGKFTALSDYSQEGWDDGSFDGTISDMACGNDVLVVGSYNTRDQYAALDGYMYGYNNTFAADEVTVFSSYGTLADGRTLPHVCAPGAVVVSSTSSFYTEDQSNRVENNALNAKLEEGKRTNYWCPAMGTSMATPLVAGSIALWLEADPTLTIDDVKDIVATTAVRDSHVAAGNPVQWGAGKFNAYEGLKEVLRRSSGIGSAAIDDNGLMMSREGDNVTFFLAGAARMDIALHNLQGAQVGHKTADGDEATLDLSALAPGVYVATVNGFISRKIRR